MATCPRCHRALTTGHKCRPLHLLRGVWSRVGYTASGAVVGAGVQAIGNGEDLPVFGAVVGAVVLFVFHEVAVRPFANRGR